MSVAIDLWNRFVASAVRDADALDDGMSALIPDADALDRSRLGALAAVAFRLGTAGLLVGAEDVARLALAVERCLDALAAGDIDPGAGLPIMASSSVTLRQACHQLASPDRSGARVEGLPLAAARYEIETLLPIPATGKRPTITLAPVDVPASALVRKKPTPTAPPPVVSIPMGGLRGAPAPSTAPAVSIPMGGLGGAPAPPRGDVAEDLFGAPRGAGPRREAQGFTWVPSVDDDMIDLFFDEASDRIDAISGKLLEIERRPGDGELLRDLFRDLHTVKGSSAMVGLAPVNQLAHAAEDLVGQLRDGTRTADAPVVDALLATLDGLRGMLQQARGKAPVTVDPAPIVQRLRNPAAAQPVAATAAPSADAAPASDAAADAAARARQTIRVDFDKLDRLLNLVGELVLGRDGLRTAIGALSSVTGELSADRTLARKLAGARERLAEAGGGGALALSLPRTQLHQLSDELNRVERVLGDITGDLDHATGRLDSISGELREQVMRLRLVPLGGVLRKHARTVRDLGASLGKRVRLELAGEDTELDKLLVEALDEPLMHLVRNAVDHGIEPPDQRVAAGKPPDGVLRLEAAHRGNTVEIRIRDDGRGMDPAALRARARSKGLVPAAELDGMDDRDALDLVFLPGFSTADTVSEVSGRGVGMDVVRQTVVSRLKGTIELTSTPGAGTTFALRLPLTLAIIQVLLARAGGEVYAIPLDAVVRTLVVRASEVALVADREAIVVQGHHVPLIRLAQILELDGHDEDTSDEVLHVVLTQQGGDLHGLACDHLVGKKEIVIKSLGPLLSAVPCVAGATLIGDRCALILDVPAIVARALRRPAAPRPAAGDEPATPRAGRVLLVEDSDIVRESLRRLLVDAGYQVTTAVDGQAGLELARSQRFDLVSTDVMMPRLDGYELTRALRALPEYRDVPIVMVTSRGERIDRVRGFDAGVDEYITKPHDRQLLLRAVKKLLGQDDAP
jgi:chemotaxis protein histidine kinase CheA/ActR/RegA family two-component response regulator